MSKKKLILIIVLFLISITTIRLTWLNYITTLEQVEAPMAVNGVLDLQNVELSSDRTMTLDGEWELFPNEFMSSGVYASSESDYIQVPNEWKDFFSDGDDTSFRYGTYRLRILLNQASKQTLSLRINRIGNASAVYVNGRFIEGEGRPSELTELHKTRHMPYSVTIEPESNEIELIIQVSNHTSEGGIVKPIRFGTKEAIDKRVFLSIGLQFFLCIVLFMHILYAVILSIIGAVNKGFIYFSLMMLSAMISVLVSDDRLLFILIPLDYEYELKIVYLSYIGFSAFLFLFFKTMFPTYSNLKGSQWFVRYSILYAFFILVAPSKYILLTSKVFLNTTLLASVIMSAFVLWRVAKKEKQDIIFLLLACIV